MRLPVTLSFYITRHVFAAVMLTLAVIMLILGIGELIEMIRRASHKEGIPLSIVFEMAAMKLPFTVEKVLPFSILIGSMIAFTRLSKSSELIIARASGISVWQFLAPAMLLVIAIGIFFTTVFNPISSAMISRYEKMENKYISGKPSTLSVSPSGLWLRHEERLSEPFMGRTIEEYILHAKRIDQSDMTMHQVIIFLYDEDKAFAGRIDAARARLEEGQWRINNATSSAPSKRPQSNQSIMLKTDLSINQIKESFASPKTLSFWELPSFIDTLQKAGFSAIRHQLHWLTLLATPLMLLAMLILGALFSLRHHRRGKVGIMIAAGVFTGFLVYFAANLVYALGFSGSLPASFAAFLPPLIAMMVGTAALLHVEDG
jgi:lipopolysaccharide export system permease protein